MSRAIGGVAAQPTVTAKNSPGGGRPMADDPTQPTTVADMDALTKAARLELAPDRAEVVAPALDGVLALFDALDAVDLGETPPTNSFDPRWRDRP